MSKGFLTYSQLVAKLNILISSLIHQQVD